MSEWVIWVIWVLAGNAVFCIFSFIDMAYRLGRLKNTVAILEDEVERLRATIGDDIT